MACVGLYGTMSYSVARQVSEIGIRMALGAQRSAVVWMVLRRVLLLAAVGLAISVPAALVASRLVEIASVRNAAERSTNLGRGRGRPAERRHPGRLCAGKTGIPD
ncbi:MAG: FtsX-like permease family protein [Paludibaculum sp.]